MKTEQTAAANVSPIDKHNKGTKQIAHFIRNVRMCHVAVSRGLILYICLV